MEVFDEGRKEARLWQILKKQGQFSDANSYPIKTSHRLWHQRCAMRYVVFPAAKETNVAHARNHPANR